MISVERLTKCGFVIHLLDIKRCYLKGGGCGARVGFHRKVGKEVREEFGEMGEMEETAHHCVTFCSLLRSRSQGRHATLLPTTAT